MATLVKQSESDAACLCDLTAGESAVIAAVSQDGPISERLLDLGFLPGTSVEFVRKAPLGDPLCFALRGCQICLRRSEAALVRVTRG